MGFDLGSSLMFESLNVYDSLVALLSLEKVPNPYASSTAHYTLIEKSGGTWLWSPFFVLFLFINNIPRGQQLEPKSDDNIG